jgi:two-component system, NtrC family, nitrogen regulation response regulator NtrX
MIGKEQRSPMAAKVLIIDDEAGIRVSLRGILEDDGYNVLVAESGEQGLEVIEREQPDLLFLDIWLPGIDGLEVLERVGQSKPLLPVIMISGHGNIETAVSAIKKGAFDFIEKPLSLEKVLIAAKKALEFRSLRRENIDLRLQLGSGKTATLTGKSPAIEKLRGQIRQVAPTEAWVLIGGENGTGKEIVARLIHSLSRRKEKPLVAVNCAAIPEELIESELFGHEKGAFTGAEQTKEGKFEMAHGGTLFLDEIGDMSLKTQAKILRILQEQCFERVGGSRTIRVDVRVIAASNKNLQEEIREGKFREDLFYRLNVFPLTVPPLRMRSEDIPIFLEEFVTRLSREQNFRPISFAQRAVAALMQYSWPGNVRELRNFVERMLIMYSGQEVDIDRLPPELLHELMDSTAEEREPFSMPGTGADFKQARAAFEKQFLEAKLAECMGNMTRLAETVGLERSYLYRKLKAFGIQTAE